MSFTYRYPRPAVTVDCIIAAPGEARTEVLLIQRGKEPFKGQWALPGGFLQMDEELEEAAARELHEETGLREIPLEELGVFGKIGRDPRGRTVSVAYLARLDRKPPARAGDDAAAVAWHPLDALPPLAFDHADLLDRARKRLISPE
jgi:8-oxo-dGTP diphosphatase